MTMVATSAMLLALLSVVLLLQCDGVCSLSEPPLSRRGLVQSSGASIVSAAASAAVLVMDPSEVAADALSGPGIPPASLKRSVVEGEGEFSALQTQLGGSRLVATELSPIQQAPFAEQELYYAPFLLGSWKVTATLKRKIYPYGKEFVPSNSLIEGSPRNRLEKVGSSTTYEAHYVSALPNSNRSNQKAKDKIIADRAYNAISLSGAYGQLTPVQAVEWDPQKDPTRLSLDFGAQPVAEDMRPLGPRRGEVYISARQAEFRSDTSYACTERSRSVTLATRNVIVSDTESISEFGLVEPNRVKAYNRIAVYLTPNPNSREGILWQQVGGKAVAFFDYDINMTRITISQTAEE